MSARHRHLPAVVRISPLAIKRDLAAVEGFNAKAAILLTGLVGTMWAFWAFNGIALVSAPSAISAGKPVILINWVSSNWLQLILLPALLVGQRLQGRVAEEHADRMFADTEQILDRVDENTDGGIKAVIDRIDLLEAHLKGTA